MHRTVREHIDSLELLIRQLNDELMRQEDTHVQNEELERKIRAAELALSHYRAALNLEQGIVTTGDAKF